MTRVSRKTRIGTRRLKQPRQPHSMWRLDIARLQRILGSSANGQHIDGIVLDREDGAIASSGTEAEKLVPNLVRELLVLQRASIALGGLSERCDLIVDFLGPLQCLFHGMMLGPPVGV